jgi:hypothetical protein
MVAGALACGARTDLADQSGPALDGGEKDVVSASRDSGGGSSGGGSSSGSAVDGGSHEAAAQADATVRDSAVDGEAEARSFVDSSADATHDADSEAGCATTADPNWADWPMPNGPIDVEAGAPNPESYSANPRDGTVTDQVTGLMWEEDTITAGQRSEDPSVVQADWSTAWAYCEGLTLAGHEDWRLPTIIELVSILDDDSAPTIDTRVFSNPSSCYLLLSATRVPSQTAAWWVVMPNTGNVYTTWGSDPCTSVAVRCVRATRANAPACRYTYPAAGTVLDTSTKLTWQRTAPATPMAATDALAYCSTLRLAGTGWRLPTVKELLTLVDYEDATAPLTGAMIDRVAFPGTPASFFWSSTPRPLNVAGAGSGMFPVAFDYGETTGGPASTTDGNYVRCVR